MYLFSFLLTGHSDHQRFYFLHHLTIYLVDENDVAIRLFIFRSKPPAAINYVIHPVTIFELPFLNIKEVLSAAVTTRQEIYG